MKRASASMNSFRASHVPDVPAARPNLQARLQNWRADLPLWSYHAVWCVPLIFVLGSSAVLLAWGVFAVYRPEAFIDSVPTISETASRWPSSLVFQILIFATVPCILVGWILNYWMNRHRLDAVAGTADGVAVLRAVNFAACALGIFAGLNLALLGVFKLHAGDWNHYLHLQLSKSFYGTQVVAFLLDGWCAIRLRRICSGLDGPAERLSQRSRAAVGICAAGSALFFLYLYVDRDAFDDRLLAQQVYVGTEYLLVILCLAYPVAPFPEARQHFRRRAEIHLARSLPVPAVQRTGEAAASSA